MHHWLENFAPDIGATFRRFPLAIILAALGTALAIVLVNEWLSEQGEFWIRLAAGLFSGAIFASAGALFVESRPGARLAGIILNIVLPLAVVALVLISDTKWVVSPILPFLGLLWLSVSAFTKTGSRTERIDIQNRFWWLNLRAITTAVISGIAFGLIAIGIIAIERALNILFGLQSQRLFYQYILPFAGLFLTPVYWLSTIPYLSDYSVREIEDPDFLSRAIGLLGQFILAPFLFIYALILLAYGAQIALTFSLPQGMLGWMVLGFTIVGAATWLVLYPAFMHASGLVRQFRRWWFWLTLVPLGLYGLAVFVRIDAYGLTAERMGLVAGGLWAVLLTLLFLSRWFNDIRAIPALAGGIILLMSVGPWNFVNLPLVHQALRLDGAIYNAQPATQSIGGPYSWSEEGGKAARGAINYLVIFDHGQQLLGRTLARNGVELTSDELKSPGWAMAALDLEPNVLTAGVPQWQNLKYSQSGTYDLSGTPYFLGRLDLGTGYSQQLNSLKFEFRLDSVRISAGPTNPVVLDIIAWRDKQSGEVITEPGMEFEMEGIAYRLIVLAANFRLPGGEGVPWEATDMEVLVFSSAVPETTSPSN